MTAVASGADLSAAPGRRTRRTPGTTGLTAAQFALAKAMPEDKGRHSLLSSVIAECQARRLLVAHFRPARVGDRCVTAVQGDGVGFPDLVISGGSRVLYRELKAFNGVVSPEQRRWLASLAKSGADVAVWTPVEWYGGVIHAELDAVGRRAA